MDAASLISLRTASSDDLPALGRLAAAHGADGHPVGLIPALHRQQQHGDYSVTVVLVDGDIVGMLISKTSTDAALGPGMTVELLELFVEEHHRHAGIGRSLLQKIIDDSRAARVGVNVRAANLAGYAFFARHGFAHGGPFTFSLALCPSPITATSKDS